MRAVVYSQPGSSDVLQLVERPDPEPGPGQVRVRLVRAGVNPTDWKKRAAVSGDMGFPEITPGQDGAGFVDAVGPGVTSAKVGDRVWLMLAQDGSPYGTAADSVVVAEWKAHPLPDPVSFDVGAALGVPAVTAHRALTSGYVHRLAPGALAGQVVLVQGGAGAVGHAAIQLATWAGATVVATVSSPEKAELARAAGARHVVDYKASDVREAVRAVAPDGVDLVVELAPAANNDADRELARSGATIAIFANEGGDALSMPVRATFSKNLRYQFFLLYGVPQPLLVDAAEDITVALGRGVIRVGEENGLPIRHYPLEEAGAAHDAVEQGVVGKVLLDLQDVS